MGDSNDLIEFSHRNDRLADLDSSQINEDDKIGASSALHKTEVLEALFSEPFYPVHAKAQRNVPVPPDLNMKAAFNSQELDTFINGTQDRNKPMLASLSFVSISESRPFVATGYGNSYANDHYAIDKASNYEEASKISKVLGDVSSSDYASSTSATPLNAAAPHSSSGGPSKPDDNQMFYLNTASAKAISSGAPMQYSDTNRSYAKNERQTRIATDATPLSELLASGHDDALLPLQSKRKHGKKSKTSGKERSSKHSTMLTREVAPAGELVSSEDEKSKRNNKQRDDNSDEEVAIHQILVFKSLTFRISILV